MARKTAAKVDERPAPVRYWLSLTRGQRWLAGGVAVLLVAGLVWAVWPAEERVPQARERQYLDYTACLLTDDKGLTGADAAPVWAGMQEASLSTRAKVQYLSIAGEQTVANASTFVASQAQGGCDLILAAGQLPVAAVEGSAGTFPKNAFLVVGGTAKGNISTVDGSPAEVQSGVKRIITDAVRRSTPQR